MTSSRLPTALLLTSTHCPHCHVLQDLLTQRYKGADAAFLTIINIDDSKETAVTHKVRSVPWLKLNSYEFEDAMTPQELDRWINRVCHDDASIYYLEHLLTQGKLVKGINWLEKNSECLSAVLPLMVKDDVKMNVRIGIGAIMEHFESTNELVNIVASLITMTDHSDAVIRADVCYYLMLTHCESVAPFIKAMITDEDEQVREIARESLKELLV